VDGDREAKIVARIFDVSKVLTAAAEELWAIGRNLPPERFAAFDAALGEASISLAARDLQSLADAWQDQLDTEAAAAEEADALRRANPLEPGFRRLG
jgi:hypothetical protein